MGALVSGAVLFLPAAPALANVTANPGQLTLKPGEQKQITITLTPPQSLNPEANISVNGLGNDVTLSGPGGCSASGGGLRCNDNAFDEQDNDQRVTITISAKNPSSLQPGQNREGSINVDANGGDDSVNVTLQGPQQAASATEVNGTVTDQATGDGVPGAQVTLKDSAGNTHDATANNQGKYTIRPSNNKPIVAGQVTVTASKENFTDATATQTAVAGRALTLNIRMKPTAASAEPSAPVASEQQPTTEPSGEASEPVAQQNTSGDGEGPSMLSWALIGMGVLLVLLGIGAIVLLVMRRKDDGESEDADGYGGNPQMAPAGAGAYDRTMVGGHSNANDQTAIVGPQQQLDEFPDPYAAPAPAPTRVGGAYSGGYDDTQAGYGGGGDAGYGNGNGRGDGYGNGGGYRDDRGYGAQQGGYDEPRGGGYGGGGGGGYADQATGVYQGGANGSEYGANGSGYGGGANGYGGGGYGGGANGAANGGGANGYGGGYDEGDYGRRGGGYQGQGGGYDRGGDYAGDPRNGRGRSNDWPE
ncbi:hypothetical protein GCM10009557_05150 [Virgisporangium ochraceum]|uniref:Carboxypeptidase regulatory-like domain-containing protein n=1 Tax=Virgisporangium ochraceum TaxID=65505 RepID=A0A8J4E879_9ACTN|nr:carboxypeptidase regulatory-like domain-containing protein [Virgisporangium ochraceum]GIJ65890.1 hypothetical protein Voc01_008070 [Virgisporangium ochraceum]